MLRRYLFHITLTALIGALIGAVAGWVTSEFMPQWAVGGAVIGAFIGAFMGTRIGAYRFARQNPEEALRQERIREGRRQSLRKIAPRDNMAESMEVAKPGPIGIGPFNDT